MRPCCPWVSRFGLLVVIAAGLIMVSGCGCGCEGTTQVNTTDASAEGECDCCCGEATKADALAKACPSCPGETAVAALNEEPAVPHEEVGAADDEVGKKEGGAKVKGPLSYAMKTLDAKPVELSKYQGKVVMFVNVASQCGLTPQYQQLEGLHEKYADKGLCIIGVPANNFGSQEPGSNEEISQFCQSKYGVKFDMLSKVSVKGSDQCDLYKFLTAKETNPKFAGDITWNFEKFLVNRHGEVVARFAPRVMPDAPEVIKAIETEIGRK